MTNWERATLTLLPVIIIIGLLFTTYKRGYVQGQIVGNAICAKMQNISLAKENAQNVKAIKKINALNAPVSKDISDAKVIYLTKYKTQYVTIEHDYAHMMLQESTVNTINQLRGK